MNITMGKLFGCQTALSNLNKQPLTASVAYKFSKITKKIIEELNFFEEKRKELFKKYGEVDPNNPEQLIVREENVVTFKKEMNDLVNLEVSIDFSQPVKLDSLGEVKLSADDITALTDINLLSE